MENPIQPKLVINPLKSVAASLLFAVFLGPVGLAYTSLKYSFILVAIFFVSMVVHSIGTFLAFLVWVASMYIAVIKANQYNKAQMKKWGIEG
jgi:hypothetical protein